MRVAFLATDTPHHTFIIWRLAEIADVALVVLDSPPPAPDFETEHPFELEQEEYEREVLLDGVPGPIDGFGPTMSASINDPAALTRLVDARPDLVIDVGTGIIREALIGAFPGSLLTMHGGNPEEYRGIDSGLWAVYNREFEKLATSVLTVDPGLDAGNIVSVVGIEPPRGAKLPELRSLSAYAGADAGTAAIATLRELGRLPHRRQLRAGRYYSWMPAALKGECVRLYEQHYAASE